jgi:SAM-dependent methyltransferase
MRHNIRTFVEAFSKTFKIEEPIVEIGSFQVPGQEELANLRSIFKDKEFIGCDIRAGKGVDKIENAECLSFDNESIGTVIMVDTIEHIENPFNALSEIYRVLKPDGIVVISSEMDLQIHNHPYDYWRFTPEAFRALLKQFPAKIIGYSGNPKKPYTVLGVGLKSKNERNHGDFEEFKRILEHNKEFYDSQLKIKRRIKTALIAIYDVLNPARNNKRAEFIFEEK